MNRVVLLVALAIASVTSIYAQRDLATLAGTVTDSSGGVVANAKVTIKETATGQVYEMTTNAQGEFVRPALKPSTYMVTVSATGFKKAEQKDIILSTGERTGITIALQVGDIGQTVEISATTPLLQTESTQVGAALNSKLVTDDPLGGTRNIAYLARLSPGVVPAEQGARDSANGGFSANGVRSNGQNNFLLNGVDNNVNTIDFLNQTSYAIGPSPDAVSEVSLITNGYNAEYGRAAGGVMNVSLKSGTNAIHGSVFEYFQNKDLDANTWTNNAAGKPRGPFNQNQFGGTLGGPIKKNTLFIFGDYQGTRIADSGGSVPNLGYSGFTTVPTALMKTGNFSSLLGPSYSGTDVNGAAINIQKGAIYDPLSTVYQTNSAGFQIPVSRTMFPGNIIPQSRMDPAFQKILQLYPNPNQPVITGNAPTNDYFYNTVGGLTTDQGDARVDYRLSPKDSLFGSLSWSNTTKTDGAPLPGALDDTGFNGAGEQDLARNAQLSYTRIWSPTLVSETRVGFTRLVTSRYTANANTDEFAAFGIGGYNPTKAAAGNGGLPQISFSNGYPTIGSADWVPTKEYNNVWDFVQNVALSKGKHAYKFGFEVRTVKFPFFQVPDPHGNLGFSNNETAFPSGNNALNPNGTSVGSSISSLTGDGIASALLGVLDSGAISTTNFVSSQKIAYAGYAQDDWKLTSKITVNIGIRYELWSPISERFGQNADYVLQQNTLYIPQGKNCNAPLPPNFATAFPTVKVDRCNVPSTLIPWDKLDFGPRIGIAYNVMPKTVIRVGFGIFYGGEENQGGSPNLGEGVPFNETVSLTRYSGNSTYVGVSQPQCTNCYFFPGGFTGGYPANPFALNAGVSLRSTDTNFRNPLVQKWNFIIQRELPHDMALEVGYEGNHQAHQLVEWNADPYPNLGTFNTSISADSLREIQPACSTCQSVGTGLSSVSTFGYGNYNAASLKLEKHFSKGLQFLSSYVWSHTLANSSTPLSGSSNFNPISQTDWATGYSSAAWDIRHSWTTSFNYELPFGKGKEFGGNMNRALDLIVGGWQANGILTMRSGQPLTLSGSCHGVWSRCLPDYATGYTGNGNTPPPGGRTAAEWFDISAYQAAYSVSPVNGSAGTATGGNVGLQTITGPPTKTLDFSMFKGFKVTERVGLQFRAEAINAGNFTVLSAPDLSLGDSKALGGNGNFGRITSSVAGTERHMQFSLRLTF